MAWGLRWPTPGSFRGHRPTGPPDPAPSADPLTRGAVTMDSQTSQSSQAPQPPQRPQPSQSPHTFQVDLRGLVDLLSHHLYSSPKVYLRELLQNAVDAITARRAEQPDAPARVRLFA